MGGAELRGSYENYYYDISYLLFVTDRRAAKYPFSSHSCRLWLYATVRLGYVETKTFRVLSFSLGAAVLDSEFRADPESGLRIEQSPAGHIESSGLKISRYQQDSVGFSRI